MDTIRFPAQSVRRGKTIGATLLVGSAHVPNTNTPIVRVIRANVRIAESTVPLRSFDRKMKLVLLGTGPFAVPTFGSILRTSNLIVELVITRPHTDSRNSVSAPVASWAVSAGIPLMAPTSINDGDVIENLQRKNFDLAIVCDYGQILSQEALQAFRHGAINLHGSLLPRHRGAAPVQWSILAGDSSTGVSVIWMTPGLDAGPVLASKETSIQSDENAAQLEQRLSQLGIDAVHDALRLLSSSASMDDVLMKATRQNPSLVTKAPRLKKADGQCDFRVPASIVDRHVRGMQPWPGVYGELIVNDNRAVRVSIQLGREVIAQKESIIGCVPGEIVPKDARKSLGLPDQLIVSCGGQSFYAIDMIQPAGKKRMTSEEFIRGYVRSDDAKFREPDSENRLLSIMKKMGD